jgi:hypothetical protein
MIVGIVAVAAVLLSGVANADFAHGTIKNIDLDRMEMTTEDGDVYVIQHPGVVEGFKPGDEVDIDYINAQGVDYIVYELTRNANGAATAAKH